MKSPDVFGVLFFVIIMPFARERENHFVNRQDLLGAVIPQSSEAPATLSSVAGNFKISETPRHLGRGKPNSQIPTVRVVR